jgi:hypothetical protein
MRDLEARFKAKALDKITHRNTPSEELNGKLQTVLQSFQYINEREKQMLVMGVIDALRAHMTVDTLITIAKQMSQGEKDKIFEEIFHDDIVQLTEYVY